MRSRYHTVLLLGLLVVGIIAYTRATPIGGAKVVLLDENGNALTGWGKVYYTIWTFDEKGSIKVLERGSLEKKFFSSGDPIKVSSNVLREVRGIAERIGSKTAFIGVDIWIVKNGNLYTLPPESFEVTTGANTLPMTFKLRVNLREAKITPIEGTEKNEPT
jgi:hypothetical protein